MFCFFSLCDKNKIEQNSQCNYNIEIFHPKKEKIMERKKEEETTSKAPLRGLNKEEI